MVVPCDRSCRGQSCCGCCGSPPGLHRTGTLWQPYDEKCCHRTQKDQPLACMHLQGRLQCPECLEKERLKAVQRRKKESPEQKECHNRHRQRRTDLLHAFGVCVRCQRRDAAPGRAQCAYCLARSRRYMQSRLREKGVMPRDMLGWPGICSRCGKPTDTQEAHKLCPACREASQHAMEIARNSRTEKNWFARTHSLMAWGKP